MRTDEEAYSEYLRAKFRPGRRQYLEHLLYPRYLSELPGTKEIWDLGFGNGEFLAFCTKSGILAQGIDSNRHFVASARCRGYRVELDDITQLRTVPDGLIQTALCDNVLEHLDGEALSQAFRALSAKLAVNGRLLAVVPGEKGFASDPTHRTFLDEAIVRGMTSNSPLVVERSFRYPINLRWVSRFFYLNMTILVIRKGTLAPKPVAGARASTEARTSAASPASPPNPSVARR